jgi:hypothetical protein
MGGKPVAAAFVADYTLETRASEIETIDNVFPAEIAPERVRVNMNLRVYRTPDNDPVLEKQAPGSNLSGQIEQLAFSQSKYVFVEIKDNLGNNVMVIPKAMVIRRSGVMSAGEFLTESWQIVGIGFLGPQT